MFKWEDKEIKTYGNLLEGAESCKTVAEAQAFIKAYGADIGEEYVVPNLMYLFGYLSKDKRERLRKLFFANKECSNEID